MNYVRLERSNTNSMMTYRLPRDMAEDADLLELWLSEYLPGWQWVSFSDDNPDAQIYSILEPDVIGPCADD